MRVFHISDPHFGAIHPPALDAFRKAVAELKPDLMILTGDITQRARTDQFIEAKKYFDQFAPIPLLTTPGNHDLPLYNLFSRFLFPFNEYMQHFKADLFSHIHKNAVEILVLNSAKPKNHIDGEFNLRKLEEHLSTFDSLSKVRMLAFHHPLDCPKGVDTKNIIAQSEAVLKLCEKYRVDIILNGHIHDPLARLSTVRYPQCPQPVILTVAGTCLSYRTRPNAPNSFHSLDVQVHSDDGSKFIEVSRYDLIENTEFKFKSKSLFRKTMSDFWQQDEI
ncbi:MAG: metallophosphoesterase [Bdellovibrionota bacterium]